MSPRTKKISYIEGTLGTYFSSPESVTETRWKTLMRTEEFVSNLKAVFFDEAHCVESWGAGLEPFRRKYAELASLHSFLNPDVPFVALTATATLKT